MIRWKTLGAAASASLALALAIGGAAALQGKPATSAKTAPKLEEGKRLFAKWCAPCHAPNPRLAGTLALQTKYKGEVPAALEQRTDLTPEVIEYFVRGGVAWMAPFRKTEISDVQLGQIAAYLTAPMKDRGPPAENLAEEMVRKQGATQ